MSNTAKQEKKKKLIGGVWFLLTGSTISTRTSSKLVNLINGCHTKPRHKTEGFLKCSLDLDNVNALIQSYF